MSYKLAIVGSRSFKNYKRLDSILSQIPKPSCIVSGGAKGADTLGQRWAEKHNIPVDIYLPDWDTHGRAAGFKRNVDIVDNCDAVLAFWDCESAGTVHSINLAVSKGKKVRVVYTDMPTKPFEGDKICGFQETHRWLSNFWPCIIKLGKYKFKSAEAAYQASKFKGRPDIIELFEKCGAIESKRLWKEYQPTVGWMDKRVENMELILRAKFDQNLPLRQKLILTGDAYLEETNNWKDVFWGVCDGEGENQLGKLLMKLREEYRVK